MKAGDMRLPGTILIDAEGNLTVEDGDQRTLRGRWRVTAGAGDLVILERDTSQGRDQARAVFAGNITREGHLIDIIGFISSSQLSGTLTAAGGGSRRELYFDKGGLRMATSNERADRLGELMHRLGKITKTQLEDAIGGLGPGKRIGEVLIQKGASTTTEIFKMIHTQVEEIFYATLVLGEGNFLFVEGLELGDLPAFISLDTHNLLLEGVRRIDEMAYFRKLIPGSNIVLQRKSRSFPPAMDNEVEDTFLGRCDGRRTLGEIAHETGIGEYEATRLAYRFLSEGALEVIPTEETKDESIRFVVDRFNDVIDRVVGSVVAAGQEEAFTAEVLLYPRSGGEFQDFIERMRLDAVGHLDFDNVLELVHDSEVREPMVYLVQVLTQYIFYVLFLSERYLEREEHLRISTEVHTMLQKIGA
jgi:hypothetical protein